MPDRLLASRRAQQWRPTRGRPRQGPPDASSWAPPLAESGHYAMPQTGRQHDRSWIAATAPETCLRRARYRNIFSPRERRRGKPMRRRDHFRRSILMAGAALALFAPDAGAEGVHVLYDFPNQSAGAYPMAGVIMDEA